VEVVDPDTGECSPSARRSGRRGFRGLGQPILELDTDGLDEECLPTLG
jgi:hypothetical protein